MRPLARRLALLGGNLPWLVVLAWLASAAWFLCDDAFISFRYARSLVEGHGLVFNAGERVEGYTNFLWVLELAALWKVFGLRPENVAPWLSVLCTVGTLAAVVWWAARLPGTPAARAGDLDGAGSSVHQRHSRGVDLGRRAGDAGALQGGILFQSAAVENDRERFHMEVEEENAGWLFAAPGMRALVPVSNDLRRRMARQLVGLRFAEHREAARLKLEEWADYVRMERGVFPEDALTATGALGTQSYFLPDLRVVDGHGLVDAVVARNPVTYRSLLKKGLRRHRI
jgi:hypothetical protein